ncbi:MAG TPA: hypothetical protein VEI07_07380, partial [Planctomycetaceae bacterium]|nr:hypothetical protein [Planctomycetaceae bacterium]
GEDNAEFRQYRQKQLKRFQDADQLRTAAGSAVNPGQPEASAGASMNAGITAPLASGPSLNPAGS